MVASVSISTKIKKKIPASVNSGKKIKPGRQKTTIFKPETWQPLTIFIYFDRCRPPDSRIYHFIQDGGQHYGGIKPGITLGKPTTIRRLIQDPSTVGWPIWVDMPWNIKEYFFQVLGWTLGNMNIHVKCLHYPENICPYSHSILHVYSLSHFPTCHLQLLCPSPGCKTHSDKFQEEGNGKKGITGKRKFWAFDWLIHDV